MGRYCYDYPRPAVTVDIVLLGHDGKTLRTLLIQRAHEPCAGAWAFPGGFLEMDESVDAAARRALLEETGISQLAFLTPLAVFGEVNRDPRGRVISLAHIGLVKWPAPAKGSDDASEATWFPVHELPPLAFDHQAIWEAASHWLNVVQLDEPLDSLLNPR